MSVLVIAGLFVAFIAIIVGMARHRGGPRLP
jgi:hypothetical protein